MCCARFGQKKERVLPESAIPCLARMEHPLHDRKRMLHFAANRGFRMLGLPFPLRSFVCFRHAVLRGTFWQCDSPRLKEWGSLGFPRAFPRRDSRITIDKMIIFADPCMMSPGASSHCFTSSKILRRCRAFRANDGSAGVSWHRVSVLWNSQSSESVSWRSCRKWPPRCPRQKDRTSSA